MNFEEKKKEREKKLCKRSYDFECWNAPKKKCQPRDNALIVWLTQPFDILSDLFHARFHFESRLLN